MANSANQFRHLEAATLTDIGRKRKNNEDAHGEFPSFGVWCVADGMGGGDDGEVASAAVVKSLDAAFSALPEQSGGAYSASDLGKEMARALDGASAWVFARARQKSLKGCGSTFVGVVFDPTDPGTALALHVGDSRLYRLRGRDLKQITKDHSVAEMMGTKDERELNPMFRGMILRAVGVEKTVDVETTPFAVREDDVVLVCSDGLTRMVPDNEIAGIIRDGVDDLGRTAARLVEAANAAGGIDNVTVTLVRVGHLPAPLAAIPIPKGDDGPSSSGFGVGTPATRTTSTTDDVPSESVRSKSPVFWFSLGLVAALVLAGLAVWFGRYEIARPMAVPTESVASARSATAGASSAASPASVPAAPVATNAASEAATTVRPEGGPTSALAVASVETNALALLENSLTVTNEAEKVSVDAGNADAVAELKAERERREREEAKAADRERERREVASEFGRIYPRDDFSDFGVFVGRALGRGAGSELLKRGKRLYQCRTDADATEHARALAEETIALAVRLEAALRAKEGKGRVTSGLIDSCAALKGRDPAEVQTQRDCMALMRAVSKGMKGVHGGR